VEQATSHSQLTELPVESACFDGRVGREPPAALVVAGPGPAAALLASSAARCV